jgi:mannose-6-phosphate isomerase
MRPLKLPANQFPRFYRGGSAIARFRGSAAAEEYVPEDWVGSTTAAFGSDTDGLSRLPDGRVLRDALAADPEPFLGRAHVERFGADPALLVKLLDAGQRLPVHCHPSREFARRHLDCPFGKTEAWVITEVRGSSPAVHLGFVEEVDPATLAGWVERQETAAMLDALHRLDVAPGDTVLVPAGVPHAIGEGVFLVELQEPTDFSVLLEWAGFDIDGRSDGHLGLGFEVALQSVDRSGWGPEALARLRGGRRDGRHARPGVDLLLPPEADPFFRAERLRPAAAGSAQLEQGFSILVVVDGAGQLQIEAGGALDLRRGDTVLLPFAAGPGAVSGQVEVIRCLPPDPQLG